MPYFDKEGKYKMPDMDDEMVDPDEVVDEAFEEIEDE